MKPTDEGHGGCFLGGNVTDSKRIKKMKVMEFISSLKAGRTPYEMHFISFFCQFPPPLNKEQNNTTCIYSGTSAELKTCKKWNVIILQRKTPVSGSTWHDNAPAYSRLRRPVAKSACRIYYGAHTGKEKTLEELLTDHVSPWDTTWERWCNVGAN